MLSLTEPSSSILRNSTQALQEINLSGWKGRGEHLFFLADESYKSWNQHLSPPNSPPKKNKDLCLNEWLLRNSEVHPINANQETPWEHPTPAIWYGPPSRNKHITNKANAGLIQIFSRRKTTHGAHHWSSSVLHPDIRRSKLHRVSELVVQRAQRFA